MIARKKVVYTLRMPKHIDEVVKERSQQLGISQNAFIMNAISQELKRVLPPVTDMGEKTAREATA